jgi:putative addiction module killer protein
MPKYELQEYVTSTGFSPYGDWLEGLDPVTIARIALRVDRLRAGNFGVHRHLGGGLFEAKFHAGPGLRVYFGVKRSELILLLCGGDKSDQAGDILRAKAYWRHFLEGEQ